MKIVKGASLDPATHLDQSQPSADFLHNGINYYPLHQTPSGPATSTARLAVVPPRPVVLQSRLHIQLLPRPGIHAAVERIQLRADDVAVAVIRDRVLEAPQLLMTSRTEPR